MRVLDCGELSNPPKRAVSVVLLVVALLSVPFGRAEQLSAENETYRAAYDLGHADGLSAGQVDRQQNRLFDLANNKLFQQADHGFDPARHEKDVYRVAYQRGFEDGYEKGYGLTSSPPPPAPRSTRYSARDDRDRIDAGPSPALAKIPEGTVIHVELLETLSTRYNEEGDSFRVRVIEDVLVGTDLAIPSGAQIHGEIAALKRAGRVRGRAKLNLKFRELSYRSGLRFPLEAAVVAIEEGDEKVKEDDEGTIESKAEKKKDLASIGKASGIGALIGVIGGGGSGAGVGAVGGAVAGLGKVLLTRGRDARLESRTRMSIRVTQEVILIPNP